jgi:transcriptional regulator with XRE-family HTH domain
VARASEANDSSELSAIAPGATNGGDAALPFDTMLADAPTIGEGIRRERLRRGLTLAQLASQVNLTVSALSQIERGASDPSISSLRRIASAFGIPMFQFLVGTDRREIVVRRSHRTKLTFPERDIEYELVSADTIGEFEVLSLTLTPGAASSPSAVPHASEECSIVLRGHVLAEVAGRTYELDAGDSIKIHRELPHRFVNQSSAEAEVVIIISPPTF